VSDIDGSTPRAQEKIGLVMKSRRKLMAVLIGQALMAGILAETPGFG
jgi:hypothetical protein